MARRKTATNTGILPKRLVLAADAVGPRPA
jgi:hypothetical protein